MEEEKEGLFSKESILLLEEMGFVESSLGNKSLFYCKSINTRTSNGDIQLDIWFAESQTRKSMVASRILVPSRKNEPHRCTIILYRYCPYKTKTLELIEDISEWSVNVFAYAGIHSFKIKANEKHVFLEGCFFGDMTTKIKYK